MNIITNIHFSKNVLNWSEFGQLRSLTLDNEVGAALILKSGGIAVVENNGNAIIINANGTLRAKLINPFTPEECFSFYYFNYENENLIVILASARGDYKCAVNERTGELSPPRETR
jgi:hypothetical protein